MKALAALLLGSDDTASRRFDAGCSSCYLASNGVRAETGAVKLRTPLESVTMSTWQLPNMPPRLKDKSYSKFSSLTRLRRGESRQKMKRSEFVADVLKILHMEAAAVVLCSAAPSVADGSVPKIIWQKPEMTKARRPMLQYGKLLSPACTEGTLPDISQDLDLSDCLMLPRRVLWRGGIRPPFVIQQTMQPELVGLQSTGSAVWSGGIALARFMEDQGPGYWRGKRVVELGCGTGLASITAAKLGASAVIATDRDPDVLALAAANAHDNLGAEERPAFQTAVLRWGTPIPSPLLGADLVIGADLTYSRDQWPALAKTIRDLRTPVLLAASERRPNELATMREFLSEARLSSVMMDSPMSRGYAAERVKLFWIDRPGDERCEFWTEDIYAPESLLAVRCEPSKK